MKIKQRYSWATRARSALIAIVVIAATCGSILAIGAQRSLADTTTPPPWDTFTPTNGATYGGYSSPAGYGAVGGLTFYNSVGQQITGGSTSAYPFAAYAEGSVSTGGTKAQLYIAVPGASDPSGWTKLTLGNVGSNFPNSGAPSNLASSTLPLFTAGTAGTSLNSFVTTNPNSGSPDAGYYQVREITTGTGAVGTEENAADILIDTTNSTWTLAYPTPAAIGTTTSLTTVPPSPASPQVLGTSVTITAQVTDADGSSPAGGTVQFQQNGAALGSPVTVASNGQAALSTSALALGSDSLTAVFTPATGTNYTTSTSAAVPYSVTSGAVSTTTVLTASTASPVIYGTPVTFTATVSDSDSTAPTGTVTFEDGGSPITGESNVALSVSSPYTATYAPTPPLSVATHSITAVYNAPSGFQTSTGGPLSYTVNGIGTTTTLTASTASPVIYGTPVTFTATVSDSDSTAPSGTVTFEDGGSPIASNVALSGSGPYTATYAPTPPLSVATHSITAVYNAPNGFQTSTGGPLSYTVNGIGTTTTLTASTASPAIYGTPVTFTATVTDSDSTAPTGTVTFEDGGTPITGESNVALAGSGPYTATYSTGTLSAAAHALSAVYNPPAGYTASTGPLAFTVNPLTSTSTSLSVSPPSPQIAGTAEALTATVSPVAATGTVQFEDGTTAIGSPQPVLGGTATVSTSSLPSGTDALSAVFTPAADNGYSGSTGTASFVVVPLPPAAPAGSTGSQSATSTDPTGTATATVAAVTATATGTGSLTVSTYASNPSGTAISDGTGAYYDASVATGSSFTSLTITICNPGAGNSLQWFNGTSWTDFSNVTTSNGCLVGTVTASTSPDLAQLTGTPVAVVTRSTGYTLVGSDGGVFNFGTTPHGSEGGKTLNKPIVGIASTPSGNGYWLVASDGGVFSFGDATFHGSTGAIELNKPIVGIASTPSGNGYWLVASDGGIFAFGDAAFHGSLGAKPLNKPIVGIASTPSGNGYWLVASDGGVFAFGDASYYGSLGAKPLNKPIVGIASTPSGNGYWLVASDGGVFSFGKAGFHGSTGKLKINKPIIGIVPTASGNGYWLVGSDGGIYSGGDAKFQGIGRWPQVERPNRGGDGSVGSEELGRRVHSASSQGTNSGAGGTKDLKCRGLRSCRARRGRRLGLVRESPGLAGRLAADASGNGHGTDRAVGVWEVHIPQDPQPHARVDTGCEAGGRSQAEREGHLRGRPSADRGTQADRHGLPEAEPLPVHVHRRECDGGAGPDQHQGQQVRPCGSG